MRQAMYLQRNIEAHSVLHNLHVCICSLSYPACNAHAPHYIVIRDLPQSTIVFRIISQTARFSKTNYRTQNLCTGFLYNFCLKHFSF